MYPPVHDRLPMPTSFERLDMLWDRYPQYHEMTMFSTLEALLEEHESWEKDLAEEGLR